MAQVKKAAVRDAVLSSAASLFETKGYHATTVSEIAAGAQTASSNVYVYFPSKFDIAAAIYQPWLERELAKLEEDAMTIADPRKRLHAIINGLWLVIPAKEDGFTKTFIQAVSSASVSSYSPALLNFMEEVINRMISSCLSEERRLENDWKQVAHIMLMAFDGFAIKNLLRPDHEINKRVVYAAVSLLLGP